MQRAAILWDYGIFIDFHFSAAPTANEPTEYAADATANVANAIQPNASAESRWSAATVLRPARNAASK